MLESLPLTFAWKHKEGKKPKLKLLDQRKLPHEVVYLTCKTSEQACVAIAELAVRGAPAIGDAAAYALVLWAANEWPAIAAESGTSADDTDAFCSAFAERAAQVAAVRPTAVNLSWATNGMSALVEELSRLSTSVDTIVKELEAEANKIAAEDEDCCRRIGEVGAEEFHLLAQELGRPLRVETHCNAGSLACARWGTALSVIYHAYEAGDIEMVWVDETRPVDQGARLTAWELGMAGVPYTLICDNMAGSIMREGHVDAVVVGADRVCRNGDFANKIGTYPLAVLAQHHGVPFYTAAPRTTFDESLATGDEIVIEQRNPEEVRCAPLAGGAWQPIAPEGCEAWNPAFDVTPHELLAGIFTEDGLIDKATLMGNSNEAAIDAAAKAKAVLDQPFMQGFIRLCSDGFKLGFHERNGGNLTYRMRDDEIDACRPFFNQGPGAWTEMGVQADNLRGAFFVVTGTGRFMRNVELDPAFNVGIVEINDAGDAWRIVWGLRDGGKPTSEFPSHFMIHSVRMKATDGASRVLYHAHPENVIALTKVMPLDARTITRALWKSMTECVMVFPQGVGVVDWMVPGGAEIAQATGELMETYDAVIWAQHGLFASGPDFDMALGLMHTIEKAAGIHAHAFQMNGCSDEFPHTITDEGLRAIAQDLNLPINETFLDL